MVAFGVSTGSNMLYKVGLLSEKELPIYIPLAEA